MPHYTQYQTRGGQVEWVVRGEEPPPNSFAMRSRWSRMHPDLISSTPIESQPGYVAEDQYGGQQCNCFSCMDGRVMDEERAAEEARRRELGLTTCYHCGDDASIERGRIARLSGDVYVCDNCRQIRYRDCTRCSNPADAYDMANVVMDGHHVQVCYDCYEGHYRYCDGCNESRLREVMTSLPNVTLCSTCFEEWSQCDGCGRAHPDSDIGQRIFEDEDTGSLLCRRCYRERGLMLPTEQNRNRWELVSGSVRDGGYTFGVEIEAEWGRRNLPWPIGGYHSSFPASTRYFFPGWRAERDGSLSNGAEMISPVLQNSAGLAEAMEALDTIRTNGGRVPRSTGQHITVGTRRGVNDPRDSNIRVQFLMAILEDAMIASTGSFYRWNNHHYCRRLKSMGLRELERQEGIVYRTSVGNIKPGNLVEFRYPPGTLNRIQMALNMGLTQGLTMAANSMTWDDLKTRFDDMRNIIMDRDMDRNERAHASIKYGLGFMVNEMGWHRGGDMWGLPYDPMDPPSITLSSRSRGEILIAMPSGRSIITRFKTQVSQFYNRFGEYEHVDTSDWKDECRNILSAEQAILGVA